MNKYIKEIEKLFPNIHWNVDNDQANSITLDQYSWIAFRKKPLPTQQNFHGKDDAIVHFYWKGRELKMTDISFEKACKLIKLTNFR